MTACLFVWVFFFYRYSLCTTLGITFIGNCIGFQPWPPLVGTNSANLPLSETTSTLVTCQWETAWDPGICLVLLYLCLKFNHDLLFQVTDSSWFLSGSHKDQWSVPGPEIRPHPRSKLPYPAGKSSDLCRYRECNYFLPKSVKTWEG